MIMYTVPAILRSVSITNINNSFFYNDNPNPHDKEHHLMIGHRNAIFGEVIAEDTEVLQATKV